MTADRQFSFFKYYRLCLFTGTLLMLLNSCVIIQKYPRNTPFVYKTVINVTGSMDAADRRDLISRLQMQLDDSLRTRVISYAGLWKVIRKPPRFDTLNVSRSLSFMSALLNAEGYFAPALSDSYELDTAQDKQKVTIRFQVSTGPQTLFDSVRLQLDDPGIQQAAAAKQSESLLKKGMPYSMNKISEEIDRLLGVLHNAGYYRMSREDLYAEVDTVIAELIDPTLDPFEQIRILEALRKKGGNPTLRLTLRQRSDADSIHRKQFYIGNVNVYPDQTLVPDTSSPVRDTTLGPFNFHYHSRKFRLPFVASHIYLIPGQRYSETNYFRTVNTFNRLGAWQNVDLRFTERMDTVPALDADLYLYPAMKRNLKIDLEASRNIADYVTTSQFFGLGLNFSLANRNAYRESIQTNTNARFGVEFGSNFIQTLQSNLSHSIYFPKLITPFGINPLKSYAISNPRSILNLNGGYTIRRDIYDVLSLNSSWGYEWTSRKFNYQFIPLNVEYTKLNGKDSLNKLIADIPSLRFAFNDGFVIGIIGGVNTSWKRKNRFSNFKVRLEESGAVFGLIRNLERNNLFRFIKADVEFKHLINYKRSALALRAFAGYGFVYGRKGDQPERILPFFKAYFAGGPYSMRAWQVRRLGPGSTRLYDTANNASNDRFGNMQLEGNVEFRFDLTTIAGVKIKSALFADVGNIWGVEFRDQAATQKISEASFSLSRLYRDIAVAGGTSLRLDFDFFLIRLDWAYKVKNPIYANTRDGWFQNISLNNGQFQLGINYPF